MLLDFEFDYLSAAKLTAVCNGGVTSGEAVAWAGRIASLGVGKESREERALADGAGAGQQTPPVGRSEL